MINGSPFMHNATHTAKLMQRVCLALIPGIIVEFYFYGWGVLINLLLCSIYALTAEALIMKLRKRSIKQSISDYSALLTGILIALSIPPLLPWWMSLIGVWFAIIFAKQLYGGLGFNPFNPAMVGYVLLLISFPLNMTTWISSSELNQQPTLLQSLELSFFSETAQGLTLQDFRLIVDGYTMATPLDESKSALSLGVMSSEITHNEHFLANVTISIWVNLSFLAGGLYLLMARIIHWHIPISMLISIGLTALLFQLYDDELFLPAWMHLIMGASMLGAFFIATDPVSAATTPKGRLIYGAGIGFIIVIIRTFGGYQDAVAFAVLLLNIAAPTIDHYTKPKVYGSQKKADLNV